MYTSTIGRTFLKAYNTRYRTEYTAKSFFEEIFIPLIFGYRKYMMTAGNSPLENPKLSWDDMIKGKKPFETDERRQERISKMIHKIETEKADASIARGYGVTNLTAATSGQITNIDLPDNKENIYLSWIGDALGIGVSGGLIILFDHEQLLLDIFEGWQHYRDYLEKYRMMKGNQINTWNGRWITHRYSSNFVEDDPTAEFNPLNPSDNEIFNLQTIAWVDVLLNIARRIDMDDMVGYLYSIGQTNTTIGFIPFRLKDILRPNQLYAKIFGESALKKNLKSLSQLYGTAMGLKAACQLGSIGIPAMEPKGLRPFFNTQKGEGKKIIYKENEEQKITFSTYLIWIMAMLNKEKLWEMSREFAKLLLKYEAGAEKGRRDRINNVNQLLGSSGIKDFNLKMIPIMKDEENIEGFDNMAKIINIMPDDNYPYFNTLIRLQYAILNK